MTRRPLMPDIDEHERYDPPNPEDNAFDEQPPKREPDYYCLGRGRWRQGPRAGKHKYCYRRAGAGTGHKGQGRCSLHGGAAPDTEMRYATLNNPAIAERIAHYLADPKILDLKPELAAGRALFAHFIEEYSEITAALLAWHASFDKKRRGLHDHPLYNIEAIQAAVKSLGRYASEADLDELHEALEQGVDEARAKRRAEFLDRGKEFAEDLKVEKPIKVKDISYAVTILKVIQGMVTAILKHEQEAFLSAFAVQLLIETYGKVTRKQLVRHLKRMGVTDDEKVEAILADISREWERTPVVEDSVPRLTAEQRVLN